MALALTLLASAAMPPRVAAGATPILLPQWAGWADGARLSYHFSSSMPLTWMRNEAIAGINASGNTIYQNPTWRQTTSGSPNVTVAMKASPGPCAGYTYVNFYGCTDLLAGGYSKWIVSLSTSHCWMNGGKYRTCSHTLTFDVWSVIHHEFLHVNNLGHHYPIEGWNSVMDEDFPYYPQDYWQNRAPRPHDLAGLATMYSRDPCTINCPLSAGTEFATDGSTDGGRQVRGSAPQASQPDQCSLGGGVADVAYMDISDLARFADSVAIAEVIDVGELQYTTADGKRPSCDYVEDASGAFGVGRPIQLQEVRNVAGNGRRTFTYWLPGGTLGADRSAPHHFGLQTPEVGDRMLAFLGPGSVDLDSGSGTLNVHAFELMAIGRDGRIHTPNPNEQVSTETVDAKVDPSVEAP